MIDYYRGVINANKLGFNKIYILDSFKVLDFIIRLKNLII